jgi:hypothetical protein
MTDTPGPPALRYSADGKYIVVGPGVESDDYKYDNPVADDTASLGLALQTGTNRFVTKTLPVGPIQSGTWTPVITPDGSRQLHTIAVMPTVAMYERAGSIVDVSVTYIINTTTTGGAPVEWADFFTLPFAPLPFATAFQATGSVVMSLPTSASETAYKGGVVLTEVGGVRLRPLYVFQSAGATQVFVTVHAKYIAA